MARLSQKQSTVLERNFHFLGLSYGDQQVMVRLPFVDMLPEECSHIVGLVFDYMRTDDEKEKDKFRDGMKVIINKYRSDANKIN